MPSLGCSYRREWLVKHQDYASFAAVLCVADLLHPIDNFPVQAFLDRDVRHCRGWRSAVPVLLRGREPYHISGPNLLHRSTFPLTSSASRRHDQRLPQRMRMPCRSCARLKCHARALYACRLRRLEQRIDPNRPREPIAWSLRRGLRSHYLDFHEYHSFGKNSSIAKRGSELPLRFCSVLTTKSQHRHFLQLSRIAIALHLDIRRCGFDLTEVVWREFDRLRSDVFFQAFQLCRARDRDDPRFLCQKPS